MLPSAYDPRFQEIPNELPSCFISPYSELVGAMCPDHLPQGKQHSLELCASGHPYTTMNNGHNEAVILEQNPRTSPLTSHPPGAEQCGGGIKEKFSASYEDCNHSLSAAAIAQADTSAFSFKIKDSDAIRTGTAVPNPQIFIAGAEARLDHQTEPSHPTKPLLVGTAGQCSFLPSANHSPSISAGRHFRHNSSVISHEFQMPPPESPFCHGLVHGNAGYNACNNYSGIGMSDNAILPLCIVLGKYPYTQSEATAGSNAFTGESPELMSSAHNLTSNFRQFKNEGNGCNLRDQAQDDLNKPFGRNLGLVTPRLDEYSIDRTAPGKILGLPPDATCIVHSTGDCLYCTTKNTQSPIEHAWGHIVNELRLRRRYRFEEGRTDILNSPERRKIAQEYEKTRIDLRCPRCGDKFSRRDATKRHLGEACRLDGHEEDNVRKWRIQVDQMVEWIELDCAAMLRRLGFRAFAKREESLYKQMYV